MRIVRKQIETIVAEHPPGNAPEGFVPYDTGWTAVEVRVVLNRAETHILRAWQWLGFVWDEQVVYRAGRLACRAFGRHNRSCRGRSDHHRYTRRNP